MQKIGITGAIASGKTTLLKRLETAGFPVFSADKIIKEKAYVDNSVINALQNVNKSYVNGKSVDKIQLLAGLKNPKTRAAIEKILHEKVQTALLDFYQVAEKTGAKYCFAEIPLLFEAGFLPHVDAVIVTEKPQQVRHADMKEIRKWPTEKIAQLDSLHLPAHEKATRADCVVNMLLDPVEVRRQVDTFLKQVS